ncbi:hypothetical protein L0P88_04200 [Muricauda sp. SCSIO 64092]|uniref:hypothetical protein n=1 Tax=Allomuricauda sp. SCSIO 64092 TaxID=2908842 RepID=UPI001FF58D7F|nr:hypothetical protein [Muricauda sp. SCSIO 64092]UOY07757.1 hypothetical protein L0P88_04200 [Muricauda sp. SCSIO 64092]
MKRNLRERVGKLVHELHESGKGPKTVRAFCLLHGINYTALHNSFRIDSLSLATVDAFKKAVPQLNMNWFLYGEGEVFLENNEAKMTTTQ